MLLALCRTLRLLEWFNELCRLLAVMETYVYLMFDRGRQIVEPMDYDSRRDRGEI